MSGTSLPSRTVFKQRAKRGGAGTSALTNTLEASQYPTSPPQSSYKGGVPKIAGSEGGFVGLLVGLIVLILVCCCVVYYLLRTRKHGGREGNKNHPPSAAAGTSKGFFSSLPFRNTRRKTAGWIQQGDEFDYESDEDLMLRKGRVGGVPQLEYGAGYGDGGKGYMGPAGQHHSQDTKPSVAVDAYTDPFDPDHLPERVHNQQAPLPASSSSVSQDPPLYKSAELKQSPTSPTFEGGTKFREQF